MKFLIALFSLVVCACAQTQTVSDLCDSTSQTNGTAITTTLMTNNCGFGPDTFSYSGTAGAMAVDSTITEAPYYKFKIGSTVYDLTSAKGFNINQNSAGSEIVITPSGSPTLVSVFFLFRTTVNVTGQAYDVSVGKGNNGRSNWLQWNGGNAGRYGPRLEATVGGVSSFSTGVSGAALKTYAYTAQFNSSGGGKLRIYDPVTWQQIGAEQTLNTDTSSFIQTVVFGVDNATTAAGYFSYFKAFVVDFTGHYPLGVPEQPSDPTSPSLSGITSSAATLNWSVADTKEQGFQVARSLDNVNYAVIGTTAAGATSYADSGLQAGTTYYYKVRAHNIIYDSGYTSAVNTTTSAADPSTNGNTKGVTVLTAGAQ